MAKPRTGFEEVLKKISLQEQISEMRPLVLRDIFSVANRKRAAVALNNELHHFHSTFIKTFIASQVTNPIIQDASPDASSAKNLNINWATLSKRWQRQKQKEELATPSFFSYGGIGTKEGNKERQGKKLSGKPEQTLEQYLETNWGPNKALNIVGYITADDIIFKTSNGEDVKLKGGKANADAAFLGKLKTVEGRDITNLTETFTIGFRAFTKLPNLRDLNSGKDAYQAALTKLFVPRAANSAANGLPLSKLLNNYGAANQKGARPLRPTVGPLLNWYYRVKLPHVFKQFYKTKGLVGR